MSDLLLVRHATCDHLGRFLAGRMPGIALDADGRDQAARLGHALASESVAAVYSSPLLRARETAAPIALAHDLPVEIREELTDIDFGEWTGAAFADLAPDPRWRLFNEQRSVAAVPGGEDMARVQARAVAVTMQLADAHQHQTIVVVSHADVIRSIILHVLGMPLDAILRIEVEPASVTRIALHEGSGRLASLNGLPAMTPVATSDPPPAAAKPAT